MERTLSGTKKKDEVMVDNRSVDDSTLDDDKLLEDIGYVPSFKREFSNLATVRFPRVSRAIDQALMSDRVSATPTDQLRVQYHGSLLVYCNDVQHSTPPRRPCICDVVLDPWRVHVLHSGCVAF